MCLGDRAIPTTPVPKRLDKDVASRSKTPVSIDFSVSPIVDTTLIVCQPIDSPEDMRADQKGWKQVLSKAAKKRLARYPQNKRALKATPDQVRLVDCARFLVQLPSTLNLT